jgi:hypothetical protein
MVNFINVHAQGTYEVIICSFENGTLRKNKIKEMERDGWFVRQQWIDQDSMIIMTMLIREVDT